MRSCLCIACLALVFFACLPAVQTGAEPPLSFSMQAAGTIPAGEPVRVHFTLTNRTDQVLWVLKWLTPLEGIAGRVFSVKCDGREMPYQGPMASRIGPRMEDYIRIGQHDSVSAEVDLSRFYNLPVGQECTVSFTGRILDVQAGAVPNPGASGNTITIPGNAVTLRIVPPKNP